MFRDWVIIVKEYDPGRDPDSTEYLRWKKAGIFQFKDLDGNGVMRAEVGKWLTELLRRGFDGDVSDSRT